MPNQPLKTALTYIIFQFSLVTLNMAAVVRTYILFKYVLHSELLDWYNTTYWNTSFDAFLLSKVDVLNQESWHTFMVLVIYVKSRAFTTDANNVSRPIARL